MSWGDTGKLYYLIDIQQRKVIHKKNAKYLKELLNVTDNKIRQASINAKMVKDYAITDAKGVEEEDAIRKVIKEQSKKKARDIKRKHLYKLTNLTTNEVTYGTYTKISKLLGVTNVHTYATKRLVKNNLKVELARSGRKSKTLRKEEEENIVGKKYILYENEKKVLESTLNGIFKYIKSKGITIGYRTIKQKAKLTEYIEQRFLIISLKEEIELRRGE